MGMEGDSKEFNETNLSDQSGGEGGTGKGLGDTQQRKKKEKMPVKSALDKAEERKREREERDRGLQELKQRMPNDNTEDHKDMAIIIRAEKYMGDYKLKVVNNTALM